MNNIKLWSRILEFIADLIRAFGLFFILACLYGYLKMQIEVEICVFAGVLGVFIYLIGIMISHKVVKKLQQKQQKEKPKSKITKVQHKNRKTKGAK